MIDQKTVVQVSYEQQREVVLGEIVKFEYYQPTPGGHVSVTASALPPDYSNVAKELVARIGNFIEIALVSSATVSVFTIKLAHVSVSGSPVDAGAVEIHLSGTQIGR
ncbi:hypothetical protein [Pectobacterium brasiliense]|uniref:hypothetical protein n=1 Tax=Pectobacterium brasiliense TaxID=180957 RepID=UPI00196916F7|nr:hypothetical protein [Pectobacterium brasiliense]MBN3161116.1 hypothetical protein [Pectobacterium brasiliense]